MGRKYKYNPKKLEHWVEKETLGTISKKVTHGTRSELQADEDDTPEGAEIAEVSDEEGMMSERDDDEDCKEGEPQHEDM